MQTVKWRMSDNVEVRFKHQIIDFGKIDCLMSRLSEISSLACLLCDVLFAAFWFIMHIPCAWVLRPASDVPIFRLGGSSSSYTCFAIHNTHPSVDIDYAAPSAVKNSIAALCFNKNFLIVRHSLFYCLHISGSICKLKTSWNAGHFKVFCHYKLFHFVLIIK